MNLRRIFLYTLIASVAVSAAIGIVAIVFGSFGEFETKILLTTLTITVTSILGLACGACFEAGRGRVIPVAGIAFSIVSAALWMVMIWSRFDPESDIFIRTVMSATLVAAACSLISLLSLARLDKRFRWSRLLAHAAVWSLTGLILWVIWAEVDPSNSWLARTMGVLSVIIASVTVITPVLHYLSSAEKGVDAIDAEIAELRSRISKLEAEKAAMEPAQAA